MAEIPDGQAIAGSQAQDSEDPDSTGKISFFSQLFRRDVPTEAEAGDAQASMPRTGSSHGLQPDLRALRSMQIEDVSVPRSEIVAIPEDASLDQVVEAFRASTVSRLPVYSDTLDKPLGLVHLKDLALVYGFGAPVEPFDLRGLVRPLLYAPPSMTIGVLLRKMQAARVHMALVIDEYGGVDGLVTIEDLLEPVVGDIADEHDEDEGVLWIEELPGVFLVQARMELDDFERVTGTPLAEDEMTDEVDTVGGLVIRLAGRVPARGEVVGLPAGPSFEIVDADARRIERLRIRFTPAQAAKAAE